MVPDGMPVDDALLRAASGRKSSMGQYRPEPAVGGTSKRAFDVVAALGLLVFLLPLFVLIAVAISCSYPGSIFYTQRRVGFGGRKFTCFKFRSMVENSDQALAELLARDASARAEWERSHKLRNDPRITRVGRLLRESSLDELPQLLNVLRGEMSLVGPRPIVDAEMKRYRRFVADYMRTRPGMTGLWQVSGRSNTDYDRRVALDVAYSRNWSIWLDLSIMLRTVRVVLKREGSC